MKTALTTDGLRQNHRNRSELEIQIANHSADTGIPRRELRQICLRAGLEQLQRGELKVGPVSPEKLPVFLHADDVILLREICEAADIQDGAAGFVDALLGETIRNSLESTQRSLSGVPELIADGWDMDDPAARSAAMLAVVERWNANNGGAK